MEKVTNITAAGLGGQGVLKITDIMAEILFDVVSRYYRDRLQIAVIANGAYQPIFRNIAAFHDMQRRIAVCDFDEELSRIGFAGADFMLMPSRFEPCGLPQMTGQYYGTLPVVHNTGGLHDTVEVLSPDGTSGNGFRFDTYDSNGLLWAMGQAMDFYHRPAEFRHTVIERVMREARERFNLKVTAQAYIDIYESMLKRPRLDRSRR